MQGSLDRVLKRVLCRLSVLASFYRVLGLGSFEPWEEGSVGHDAKTCIHEMITIPGDQNSPKALYSMVFGPKSLNI